MPSVLLPMPVKLAPEPQVRRIRRTEAIAEELVPVRVETEGEPQTIPALALRALPFWLAGISTRTLTDEVRPMILAYQREIVDMLYRHFAERRPGLAASQAVVPSARAKPPQPAQSAPSVEWLAYHEQMVIWYRWQANVEAWREDVEQWRGTVEDRLEGVEEVARLVPEILDRLGPATLTPERQQTVKASTKRLHELTGIAYATICDDLRRSATSYGWPSIWGRTHRSPTSGGRK